ncbi:MAG: hypothetical protein QM214_02280 [Bacillota bacterium]|nr:hypothetical protein [Bacillota bacterium]HHU43070.1 hypothetical protein [Clostridiales bacterium]
MRSNVALYKGYLYFLADMGRVTDYEGSIQILSRQSCKLICIDNDGNFVWGKQVAGKSTIRQHGPAEVVVQNDKVLVVTDFIYLFKYDTGDELYKSEQVQNNDSEDPFTRMAYIRPKINETNGKAYFIIPEDSSFATLYEFDFTNQTYSVTNLFAINELNDFDDQYGNTHVISFDSQNK